MNGNVKTTIVAGILALILLLMGIVPDAVLPSWVQKLSGLERSLPLTLGGFAAGVGAMAFSNYLNDRQPLVAWAPFILPCATAIAVAAIHTGELPLRKGVLLIALGSVAVVAAVAALARFKQGESIEVETNWGGLGGGLGGWRITTVTSLTVLAMVFAGAAAAVLQAGG